ncbi:CRP-like cAMP-binding protein [Novosphingobium sp. PhB165]|uniref:Crp/Fnr family transcriptional regulator n=1 Tax=Novosphingobium sp. PhB165 TaxID=2485105 RepID=UPI00104A41F7|nr:Crp/Fnr family transcriptional regulator [Novosphingobium sp. PhB165]TCM19891.1 CRP-like cAMP-binding protein [Novosphingobium sp. PhB165]
MDSDEKIEIIRTIFRCDRLSAEKLARVMMPHRLAARDILARQGEESHHCWLVIDGGVRIEAFGLEGQRQQLAQYGPGEFFGAYPMPTVHRAEIASLMETNLLRAEAVRIAELVAEDAQIGAGMARLLARQLDRALDRMMARTTYSAAGRVYAELLSLAAGADRIAPAPKVTMLALSANTTRETASRAIAALIRRGIISRDDRELIIHAPRMLMELVC